jgi:soluble lytic murein transglycosylase
LVYRTLLCLLIVLLCGCSVAQPGRQTQTQPTDQSLIAPNALPSRAAGDPPSDSGAAAQPSTPLSNDQLLALSVDQRIAGEYEAQAATLQQLLTQQPDADQTRQARYGLAETALLLGRPDEAAQRLDELLADGRNDALSAQATLLLARAHEDAGRWQAAIEAYQRYRALKTPLEPYAALRQAAQERAAGQIEQAVATYEYVAQQPIARGRRAEALEYLIEIYGAAGRSDLQLARYRDLLAISENADYRAPVLMRAARLAGDTDEGRAWLREIIVTYPARSEAMEALAALQASGSVSALEAAQINFVHEQYLAALPLFDAALAGELTPEQRFETRRQRALSLRALERYDEALSELGALAQERPVVTITDTAQAELDYMQTAGWSGNTPFAIDGYRRFAGRFPELDLAPEALWRAIQLQQNQGDQEGAMAAALDLGRAYPRSTQAHIALTQAGMHYYQSGQRDQAIQAWQLLGDGATGWDSAEGRFWAGTALVQAGRGAEAGAQLQAAVSAAPQSFYGMRARELLKQTTEGATPLASGPSDEEQRAVTAWIASWAGAAPPELAAEVAQNANVVRGRELGRLDLRNEARDEWFAARDAWNDDPLRLWHLALQAHNADQPYVALKAAERIVALSSDKRLTPQTPTGLLRLIYPTPYARVVEREARQFAIDPRLIYALLRQESLFNPDATSWVGARGLGQVMPATGAGIAQNLQVENYSPDLLYRPAVSIRFAAHYISHQLRAFDNSILAAASAYNGGPGNAARWLENTADPDLFAELIDYRETRDYVKIVYGNWGMYQMLYSR